MKTNFLLITFVAVLISFMIVGQELPPKHRGELPRLHADGKVVDKSGKQLGYITKEGKVCDVTGKVIGIISETGDVTTVGGKRVGRTQTDGSFKSNKGYVVTDEDGVLKVQGKVVGHVDKAYSHKAHACAMHCFFNEESEDANEIDKDIY